MDSPPPFGPAPLQRTTKSSKNAVQTAVFVGHTVWCPVNSVPKPGPSFIRSQKITVRTEVSDGQSRKASQQAVWVCLQILWQ